MADEIKNRCKNCAGELKYDPISGELKCTHCNTIVDIPEQQALIQKRAFSSTSQTSEAMANTVQYKCLNCGGRHNVTNGEEIGRCPNCGSSDLEQKSLVTYQPDGIVPFKLDKEKAMESFREWLKKRKFAPNNLKRLAKSQKMTGMYIPVYSYDFDYTAQYSGTGVNTKRVGDQEIKTKHRFNETENGTMTDFLSSANTTFEGEKLRDMGNFGLEQLYVYRTEFLYGWSGMDCTENIQNNYNKTRVEVSADISKRIEQRMSRKYDRVENFSCNTSLRNIKFSYLYLPVWVNHYKYNKKDYYCYINGCTGKVTGKSPKSFWKIFFTVLAIVAAVGAYIYFSS